MPSILREYVPSRYLLGTLLLPSCCVLSCQAFSSGLLIGPLVVRRFFTISIIVQNGMAFCAFYARFSCARFLPRDQLATGLIQCSVQQKKKRFAILQLTFSNEPLSFARDICTSELEHLRSPEMSLNALLGASSRLCLLSSSSKVLFSTLCPRSSRLEPSTRTLG